MMFGSPQASPAIIVFRSPFTTAGSPVPFTAPLYRQAAALASTMMNFGGLCGYRFVKYPTTEEAREPTPACTNTWVGRLTSTSFSCSAASLEMVP